MPEWRRGSQEGMQGRSTSAWSRSAFGHLNYSELPARYLALSALPHRGNAADIQFCSVSMQNLPLPSYPARRCSVTGQRRHAEAARVKALHKRCSSVMEKLHFWVKGKPFSSAHLKIYSA